MEHKARLSIVIDTGNAERDLQNLRRALADLERSDEKTGKGMGDVGNNANNASRSLANSADNGTKLTRSLGMIKAAALGLAGIGLAGLGSQIVATQREFDALNAQLITATGSIENASVAFSQLQEFAKTTPYGLAQSVEGFAKLKNLGLEPSIESLTSFGNTASAMGKDLMQMIEAVADATTGEFERLKEFGIKSSKQGDQITFTFQGVKTTVKNNAKDIQKYLLDIGNVNFAGAMDARAKTLDGAIASLGDSWSALLLTMSQGGIGDALAEVVRGLDDILGGITSKLNDPAVIEGFKVTFGTISEMLNTIKTIIGEVITAIQNGTQFVLDNAEAFTALASGIGASATAFLAIKAGMAIFALFASGTATVTILSTAIGVLTGVAGAFGAVMAVITSPITLAVIAIGALVAISVYLYRNWDEVKAKTEEVWFAIGEIVAMAVENVKSYFGGIGEWFGGVWESVKTAISTKIDEIKQAFWQWLAGMPAPVQEMVANIISIFDGMAIAWDSLKTSAQSAWQWVKDTAQATAQDIATAWQGFVGDLSATWNDIKAGAKSAWDGVVNFTKPIIDTLTNIVETGLTVIVSVWQAQFTAIKLVAGIVFEGIKAVVGGGINAIKAIFTAGLTVFASVFNTGFGLIKNIFTTTFAVIKALVRGDMEGVKQAISNGIKNAWNIVKSGVTNIVGAFKNLGSQLMQAGRDAIQGFINGVKEKMSEALNVACDMANSVASTVKSALNIHSPSRVMRELGAWAGEGFVLGVGDKVGDAKQVAQNLANALTSTVADLHRQNFMLKNHANPLADLDYKLQFGELAELTDKQKERLRELAKINLDIQKANEATAESLRQQEQSAQAIATANERSKSNYDNLQKQIALFGNQSKLAEFDYDWQNGAFGGVDNMLLLRERSAIAELERLQYQDKIKTAFEQMQGGLAGELSPLAKLQKEFDDRLQIIKDFENAHTNVELEAQQARQQAEQAYLNAKNNLMLTTYEQGLGAVNGIIKSAFGEQSGVYRAMFAMEKGMALARVLLQNKVALANAWSSAPFPKNLPIVAKTAIETGALSGAISAINPVIGQAHDGIMSVPKSGTWNLEKGERVLPRHTAKALDDRLDSMGGGQVINVHVTVNSDGSNVQADAQMGKTMGEAMAKIARQVVIQETKQNGHLDRLYRR